MTARRQYQIVGNESLQDKDVVQIIVTAEDGTIGLYSIFVAQPSPTTSFSLDNNLLYIVIGLLVLLNIINLGLLISLNRRYINKAEVKILFLRFCFKNIWEVLRLCYN